MKSFFSFIFLLNSLIIFSQAPSIQWQKSFGGSLDDDARSIQQTSEGGYIYAGYTNSNDGDLLSTQVHGNGDCWVVKLKNTGSLQWQTCFGGTGIDRANSIKQTADGGYIIAGSSDSNDGDVLFNRGKNDCWIAKLDNLGVIEWKKTLGGTEDDFSRSIQQTADGADRYGQVYWLILQTMV